MNISTTIEQIKGLKLNGMVGALEELMRQPEANNLAFEERLGIIVDREVIYRDNKRRIRLLRYTKLKFPTANVESIDYQHPRKLDRASDNLNTTFNSNQYTQPTEIEIIDPTHPLFGKKFSVLFFYTQNNKNIGHVVVKYEPGLNLRIPLSVTNLNYAPISYPTKLTALALKEFISLAKELQICQQHSQISGKNYHRINNKK